MTVIEYVTKVCVVVFTCDVGATVCPPEKPQRRLILGGRGSRTETVRKPASLASQGVSSLGEPASRRRSPFYCGSGDGPDELSSFYFVVVR